MKIEFIAPSNSNQVFYNIGRTGEATKIGIRKAFHKIGRDLKGEFKRQVLAKNKTGRLYKIRGKLHQSSAPQETPANLTGNYRKSIGYAVSGTEMAFGNDAEYAGFLENGTSRMRKRPGLRNTIKAQERNTLRHLLESIEDEIS